MINTTQYNTFKKKTMDSATILIFFSFAFFYEGAFFIQTTSCSGIICNQYTIQYVSKIIKLFYKY